MAIQQIKLNFNSMNVSAQVGDIAYYSYNPSNIGGFDHSTLSTTKKLGTIFGVSGNSIGVLYNDAIVSAPPTGAFISFAKDKRVNTSSLLGYYADVKFVNDSTEKAELFSVGSDIEQSSK